MKSSGVSEMIEEVKAILSNIEARRGVSVPWLVYGMETDPVRHVRVEVYPPVGNDYARMFDLSHGLTPGAVQAISEWFVVAVGGR
jgi:hypothetical protein